MVERIKKVREVVNSILDFPAFMEAVIADGWTEQMAAKGFALHKKTWQGIDSVSGQVQSIGDKEVVQKICHIWPALPGAGVSPVLFGALCGVKTQHIKASRRGQHFANYFVSLAKEIGVSFNEDLFSSDYERLIVSGTDETIAYFNTRHEHVIGFGHRESIAVVDTNFQDFQALANDIAQWDQQGCFSVRAVFYIGEDRASFCQKLAVALFDRQGSASHHSDVLSDRIQKRAIKEMTSEIFVDPRGKNENCAWVESTDSSTPVSWSGGTPAAGCVSVYTVNPQISDMLFSLISLPPHQRQGVALSVSKPGLENALLESGFTHISKVGQMQSPPLAWLHDGRSNIEMFLK